MFRRKISILVLLVLLLSLFTVVVQAQDATEIQIAWWGSQSRHDRTIAVLDMYAAEHPGITFTYEFAAFAEYWTLMNTKAAGDQLPCIMQQDYAYLTEWSSRGLLAPLDPFIESGAIDTTNVDPSLLAGGVVDGVNYAISLGTNSQSIIIDVDAFEQAGIPLPDEDWTWAEFEDIATQLHEALGIWAIDVGNNQFEDRQVWLSMNLGYGQSVVSEDGKSLAITDWQPTIDFFNMIQRLQAAGVVATGEESAEFAGIPLESSPIVTQDTAMQYQWSNQVVAVFNGAGPERNFVLRHLPRPEGGQPSNYLKPSQFFSVTSSCANPEIAADVINFFTNDLEANEILFAERGVPISSAVRDHLRPMLDVAGTETFDYLERVTADSSPLPAPDPAGWSNFTNNVYQPLFTQPLIYGQITPEEAVQVLETEGNAVLADS